MLEILKTVSKLYVPLYTLDFIIKSQTTIRTILEHRLRVLSSFLARRNCFQYGRSYKFYLGYSILPKIILLILFLIDIFYFHQFYLSYFGVFLGLIPLIKMYIIYSIKQLIEKDLQYIEKNFYIEYIEKEDEDDLAIGSLRGSFGSLRRLLDDDGFMLSIKTFLEFQVANIQFDYKLYKYACVETWSAREAYAKEYNVYLAPTYSYRADGDEISKALSPKFYALMPHMIHMKAFVDTDQEKLREPKVMRINMIIISIYLCCWVYILLVSIHTLNIVDVIQMLAWTWRNIEEPFSCIPLMKH